MSTFICRQCKRICVSENYGCEESNVFSVCVGGCAKSIHPSSSVLHPHASHPSCQLSDSRDAFDDASKNAECGEGVGAVGNGQEPTCNDIEDAALCLCSNQRSMLHLNTPIQSSTVCSHLQTHEAYSTIYASNKATLNEVINRISNCPIAPSKCLCLQTVSRYAKMHPSIPITIPKQLQVSASSANSLSTSFLTSAASLTSWVLSSSSTTDPSLISPCKQLIIPFSDVQKHNTSESVWVVVDRTVYDVTNFLKCHPAGAQTILRHAGTDVTEDFMFHSNNAQLIWRRRMKVVGVLDAKDPLLPQKKSCNLM